MLTDIEYVKNLQGNIRASLESPQGKEVILFLEKLCFWYDFTETDTNMILISHGRRQVLATIKTLIELKPEQIVALTRKDQ